MLAAGKSVYRSLWIDLPNEDPDGDGVTLSLNLRFPGQYYDAETGLHYNVFRDYDPATGRYVQSDQSIWLLLQLSVKYRLIVMTT